MRPDPLADPEPLIRRVYAYVAYRLGEGPDAEDVTSATIERALRYRASYDPRKGKPQSWLIGIARSCIGDHFRSHASSSTYDLREQASPADVERETVLRLSVRDALAALDDSDRDLIALRYGADLSARQIGALLDMKANAVHVALFRARDRLRRQLEGAGVEAPRPLLLGLAEPAETTG
jgi:RNA polymerase sigma-70 factor, ECF subfamily